MLSKRQRITTLWQMLLKVQQSGAKLRCRHQLKGFPVKYEGPEKMCLWTTFNIVRKGLFHLHGNDEGEKMYSSS